MPGHMVRTLQWLSKTVESTIRRYSPVPPEVVVLGSSSSFVL
jgi:hypothetical protein